MRLFPPERRGDGSRSPTPPPHSAPVVPSKGLRFSPEVEEMEMGRAAEVSNVFLSPITRTHLY